jgi:hypothetical protein
MPIAVFEWQQRTGHQAVRDSVHSGSRVREKSAAGDHAGRITNRE